MRYAPSRKAWRASWARAASISHSIIDGAIDTAFIRDNFPDRYALKSQDGILNPDHIADAYWMLRTQPRDAWTQSSTCDRIWRNSDEKF